MGRFIFRLTIFVGIFVFIIFLIEKRLAKIPNSYTLKRDCIETNLEKLNLLIFGSSQAQYGLDPEAFSPDSCNMANANQDLYYDSLILNKYLDSAKNLKTVIFGISYFSLEFRLANTDEAWRRYFYYHTFKIAFPDNFVDTGNFSYIWAYSPSVVRGFIEKSFKVDLLESQTIKGWYKSQNKYDKFDAGYGKERAILHTSQMKESLREANVNLLKDLLVELKNRNIKVIIVTLPVVDTYSNNVDEEKYNFMVSTISNIAKKYNAYYINLFKDERFIREDFADNSDHLNEQGSNKLGSILLKSIK